MLDTFTLYKGYKIGYLEEDEAHVELELAVPVLLHDWVTVNRSISSTVNSSSRAARSIQSTLTRDLMNLSQLSELIRGGHPQAETLLKEARSELQAFILENGRFAPYVPEDWEEDMGEDRQPAECGRVGCDLQCRCA
jgi:hypothetical protein